MIDANAMQRLIAYTRDSIAAQPPDARVPLAEALAAGRVSFAVEDRDGFPHAKVTVDGHEVCSVDVRNLVPLDDAL